MVGHRQTGQDRQTDRQASVRCICFETRLPQFNFYVCASCSHGSQCLFMPAFSWACVFGCVSVGLCLCSMSGLERGSHGSGRGSGYRLGLDDSPSTLLWFGARIMREWVPVFFFVFFASHIDYKKGSFHDKMVLIRK